MKKRRNIVLGIVALLLGGGLFWFFFHSDEPNEPMFQKASVSRWFARFCLRNRVQMRAYDGLGALRVMGTNGIAYLVALNDAPINSPLFAQVELQAQREVGSGDGPTERLERTMIRLIDAEADPRRATLLEPNRIQEEALNALAYLKPKADMLLPLLTERLKSPEPHIRERALALLGYLSEGGEKAEPYLIRGLEDEDEKCRRAAAESVGWSGIRSKALVNPLIAALNKAGPKDRTAIGWALGKMGANANEAVPRLVEMLAAEKGSFNRITIAAAVHGIDRSQPDAFRALVEGLTEPSLQPFAAKALGPLWKTRTNATDVLPLLSKIVGSEVDFARRVLAAQVVCDLEPTNRAALRILIEALSDRNYRKGITEFLAGLTPRPVVPPGLVIGALPDEDLIYSNRALDVLLSIGPQKAETMAALTHALSADSFRVRLNAATCLLLLDANNATALAVMTENIKHFEYPGWVVRTADALGVAGTNASDAVPALTQALEKSTTPLNDAIRIALEKIRPPKVEPAGK